MNSIETCLLLALIPLGLIAAGYWLAAQLTGLSPAERLAVAMLAGLGVLLWTVSVVNLALPLAGIWGWVCVLPVGLTFARAGTRRRLRGDFSRVAGDARTPWLGLAAIVFLTLLLWPLLGRPDVVFYDGSSAHDAFFWIVGAEHLKRQTYLQAPVVDPASPLYYSVAAIVGWRPAWGRMGAEGLLALVSNLAGASPLKIYVAATAALFFPWVAAVFLVVRTFVGQRLTPAAGFALVALQPMFVFFHGNANLPNLLGVLAGAMAVVATARALQAPDGRRAWLAVVVLSLHGLACSYPEMMPAILLPCGVLWVRAWRRAGWRPGAHLAAAVVAAVALAAIVNPATTLRAWNGFFCSLDAGQHPERLPNIFGDVSMAARFPAMATLSVPFGRRIGPIGGGVCGVLLAFGAAWAWTRARDRVGAAAMFAGAAAMLAYTMLADVGYGWQKTVQFSAVFVAAILPVAAIGLWRGEGGPMPGRARIVRRSVAALIAAIFVLASATNLLDVYKWAGRKFIAADWFAARDYTRRTLRNAPVLVDAGTFPRPFFYTMWAAYFLTDSRVYFRDNDPQSGGYLRTAVVANSIDPVPPPRAVLVGSPWAKAAGAPGWTQGMLALLPVRPRGDVVPR